MVVWIGLIWVRIGSSDELFASTVMNLRAHKILRNSLVIKQIAVCSLMYVPIYRKYCLSEQNVSREIVWGKVVQIAD
jgi:hypothetical protein